MRLRAKLCGNSEANKAGLLRLHIDLWASTKDEVL